MRAATLLFAVPLLTQAATISLTQPKALSGAAVLDPSVAHNGSLSVRVEPTATGSDARIELQSVSLTPGKRYVLSAWVRTNALTVEDHGRSPIATGAALTLGSMPYDVHSPSLGGTRDWSELRLPFTASVSKDTVVLTAGLGGTLHGTAWFSDVHLEGPVSERTWPSKAALQTYGPAYRYPEGGWIYLHIEGEPYERGYQHGRLLSHEIETYLQRCASELDSSSRKQAWDWGRTSADALFLRSFDAELLQEMKGIADGAADAGAKFDDRKVDLLDIVTANTLNDLAFLRGAMPVTPTGLELFKLEKPPYSEVKPASKNSLASTDHCSAFCANGKATRDGRMVIGHITMWPLTLAEQTNIMLDVQPTTGHRVLMQSYPGGIQSGTDWYQNDVGVVLTETTIRQSPFNISGLSVAYRARKAIQYGDDIDAVVKHLGDKNNGLYTNEWLIADARTNEIAMYELGTYKTRLYRSSNKDWFGGTEGFYWGDNNAKDLQVRLEYQPDPHGEPAYVPYVAEERDLTWQNLYEKFHGQIDQNFAFLAFRTAPLVTSSAMDAKVLNAEMAKNMMVWANFGKPNQREWVPREWDQKQYDQNQGLYSSGYHLFSAAASPELQALVAQKDKERLAAQKPKDEEAKKPDKSPYEDRLWKGWILPASSEDTWLAAGSASYYNALADADYEKRIARLRAGFAAATLAGDNELQRFQQASCRGALLLDALRKQMGDDRFFAFMKSFFDANTTKPVSTAQFRAAAGPASQTVIETWLNAAPPASPSGPIYVATDFHPLAKRLANTVIVYGTSDEAGANRYAAEQVAKDVLEMYEDAVPVRKDFEVTDRDLRDREVIFVGRPATNSALAAWQSKLSLNYDGGVFTIDGKDHGAETESLAWTAANPLDPKHMVLVLAGNSPVETVRVAKKQFKATQYAVYDSGKETSSGFFK
jgi:hypothetical protein